MLSQCDLVVVPSTTAAEAFGMVIVESFSYGKPVVTTTLQTGVSFLARDGLCGAVTTPGSASELTQAINHLLSKPQALKKIGEDNFTFWQKLLSREAFSNRYIQIINNVDPRHQPNLENETSQDQIAS